MKWNFLRLKSVPILQQLQLEEALLRTDSRNWCIFNEGAEPAIVLGISSRPQQVIQYDNWKNHPIPVIRRYTGGGTVVVDEHTGFVTFICQVPDVGIAHRSREIMDWSEKMYRPVFDGADFRIQENDYVLGQKKVGGNAQYLSRNRWVHHTSFLWDWNRERMRLLAHPPKEPAYREGRSHEEFLVPLHTLFSSLGQFFDRCKHIWATGAEYEEHSWEEVKQAMLTRNYRTSSQTVEL